MAKPRTRNKTSDDVYNARRRFARAAERNLEKAKETSGATSERYRQLARQNLESAIDLYDSKSLNRKSAQRIRQAAGELGVDLEGAKADTGRANKLDVMSRSFSTLESNLADDNFRREQEARALLNDDRIGSRILGGLVDVWRDKATIVDENGIAKIDNAKIMPALFDYFGVENLADMLDKLEDSIGSKLYEMRGDADNIYEHVKVLIQTKVLENTLVQ